MMTRIVILGANGQVGAEICARLSAYPGLEIIPCSRTRNGSAFLRSFGIAVRHGSVATEAGAQALLGDADVVVNLALSSGVGKGAVAANHQIIDGAVRGAPSHAKQVFFSTLAVNGSWDAAGRRASNSYGALKRRNERYFLARAKGQGCQAWVCRLGHVLGDWQGLYNVLRDEIESGPILLPDPDRASNVTHVSAICEALAAIARGDVPPGSYDLVNVPQWRWREVYDWLAEQENHPVAFEPAGSGLAPNGGMRPRAMLFGAISKLNLRNQLERFLAFAPVRFADRIKAIYMVNRAASEIAALSRPRSVRNAAAAWPALPIRALPNVRETVAVLQSRDFALPGPGRSWPADIAPAETP